MQFSPVIEGEWWDSHVQYSKVNRQGLDIITAEFINPEAKSVIILVTGLSESFLKYAELIRSLYERGHSIFTYDHQSQGLSGRWLPDHQSIWCHTFEDYVDDFLYIVDMISREMPSLSLYVLAQGFGGLITGIAMSRLPLLVSRCIMTAPMFRNQCRMKAIDYRFPLPQPIAYFIAYGACMIGLGTSNAIGFFKEVSRDKLKLNITTSDIDQLDVWQELRHKYPQIMSSCITNDWIVQSIRAQKKLSKKYGFIQTNTLILAADPQKDVFVYNRAMAIFLNKAPQSRMFYAPNAYHDILFENDIIKGAVTKVIQDFFSQESDEVELLQPCSPLVDWDRNTLIYSPAEVIVRALGVGTAVVMGILGVALIFSGGPMRRR
mmetsp:Transcript_8488/g.8432  ORF Transcript_8488/g.8432 Transcript_8488/m.8432 type:complete len:377 (-) Transcript_8488:534-1664(-)